MERTKVAIIGPGNAGSDLMYKVFRSRRLELALMTGIVESEGIKRARGLGVETSIDGVYGIISGDEFIRMAFDCSSAKQHPRHATVLRKAGILAIDITPSGVGHIICPWLNIEQAMGKANISMATCAAQATAPIIHAVNKVAGVEYAEVVACMSSYAAGPASRENVDNYTAVTARAIVQLGAARSAKAIAIFNPIQPPLLMTNTIYMRLREQHGTDMLIAAVEVAQERVREGVPGYRLRGMPKLDGDTLEVCVEVEGSGDYLPSFSGNLHILNSAAVATVEYIAEMLIA